MSPNSTEDNDVGVLNIVPKDRGLNKERGCAAVSTGEKLHRSDRRSCSADSPTESAPGVQPMLCAPVPRENAMSNPVL